MANKRKGKKRGAGVPPDKKRLRKLRATLEDGLNELSFGLHELERLCMRERESLRMQMFMDRHAKFLATLSNLLRKMADAQSAMARAMK